MFALSGVWKRLYLMESPCWADMTRIFEFLLHFDYYSDSVTKPDYYYFTIIIEKADVFKKDGDDDDDDDDDEAWQR